jgi:hypothetical protein
MTMLTVTSLEVYFLQDLVLFNFKVKSLEEIKAKLEILANGDREDFKKRLQKEADRLGHKVEVAKVLARVQISK